MSVTPQEAEPDRIEASSESGDQEAAPGESHQPLDALRSWLVNGVQFVDRRRRFGTHARARELLVAPSQAEAPGASQRWHTLAAALHRYTVRSGLSELTPQEQQVITLAYLEGRTNREIAAVLGVSITTARRRLWVALGRLEAYVSRSGVWLTAFLLGLAAYTMNHSLRLGRWVSTSAESADRAQRLTATLAAGVMVTAAVGAVAFTSDSRAPARASHSSIPRAVAPSVFAAKPSASVIAPAIVLVSNKPKVIIHKTALSVPVAHVAPFVKHKHHKKDCDKERDGPPPEVTSAGGDGDPHQPPGGCED